VLRRFSHDVSSDDGANRNETVKSKPTLHRETGAESSLDRAGGVEAARSIEAFRVRVADDVQDARGAPARDIGAMFDLDPDGPMKKSAGRGVGPSS
jgi:hypothetical protein